MSRAGNQRPPQMRRKESASRSPPQQSQESVTDSLAAAAMRPFERGRRPTRRETGGSGSERSDSPVVWRPTISQPTLQQDSLGIGAGSDIIVEPFKQRLVPFRPSKNGRSVARGQGLVESPPRPQARTGNNNSATATKNTTALSLFPNLEQDEKVAVEAFAKMFETEQKAHAYQAQAQAKAMAQAQAQTDRAMSGNGGSSNAAVVTSTAVAIAAPTSRSNEERKQTGVIDEDGEDAEYNAKSSKSAAVARKVDKILPNVPLPTALRRIKTGQVKTVTVVPPTNGRRPLKRSNTADVLTTSDISAPTNFVKVKAGGPLFSFAGVTGGVVGSGKRGQYAQEFEIVTGPDGGLIAEPAFGAAF